MAQAEPSLRSLEGELDALQGELLAAYRPPASIDRHREFIVASAAIKEARELEAAGLRHGALYRYLEAVLRVDLARAPATTPDAEALASRLREWNSRLSAGPVDQSLGRLYLEAPGLLGGDAPKAIEYLEKGLRLGPDNSLLRAYLAKAYVEAHRNEDAHKQIDAVLAMKPTPGYEPEHKEALDVVKKLEEKLK
jgi:predicted Zn-dependent protease